jgi:exodeoxyribonuclease VII small subunit
LTDPPLTDPPLTDPASVTSQPVGGSRSSADSRPVTDPQSVAESQPMTYETAAARVEEIIRRLDSGEASLNETLALVQEGKTLIELCASELEAVGAALEELRLDELVARLEDSSA